MGLYSWICAKTFLPVLAGIEFADHPMTCVELRHRENGRLEKIRGVYDGYGRIDGIEINDLLMERDLTTPRPGSYLLLRDFAGDVPDDFEGVSPRDPGQGYFFDRGVLDFLSARGSMPSPGAYALLQDGTSKPETAVSRDDEVLLDLERVVDVLRTRLRRGGEDWTGFAFKGWDAATRRIVVVDRSDGSRLETIVLPHRAEPWGAAR